MIMRSPILPKPIVVVSFCLLLSTPLEKYLPCNNTDGYCGYSDQPKTVFLDRMRRAKKIFPSPVCLVECYPYCNSLPTTKKSATT